MEVILVRHGEPRYDEIAKAGFKGLAGGYGKLTKAGVKQATERAKDPQLKGATLIIASPYTRALQTAAIISRLTNIPLTVEHDLHEWMDDTKFIFDQPIGESYDAYKANKGLKVKGCPYRYETYEQLRKRVTKAIKKHKNHDKVIVVCHGVVMSSLTHFEDLIEFCGTRVVHLNF